jgi:basic membrane protein A
VGDMGWSFAHDQGRQSMAKQVPTVETSFVEAVAEGPDAERVLRDLASKGSNVIFATSFGYMDSVLAVAKEFPNVVFEHCTGYKTDTNVGIYDGRGYQGWYLAGIVAGKMTKKNVLGYVAPYPIPEVVRNMNAFTLGARSVSPNVQVHIVWINAWFDPAKEREAAQALIDQGADVVARESDSAEPDKLCEQAGVYAIGYNSDSRQLAPKAVLTAPIWDWGLYYSQVVQAVQAGTWNNTPYWGSMADGIIKLAPFGPMVPDQVKSLIESKQKEIVAGTFDVFVGPIKDNTGKERVAKGVTMSDPDKLAFNWLVEGIVGTIPQ